MKKERGLERVINIPSYLPKEFNVDVDGFLLLALESA